MDIAALIDRFGGARREYSGAFFSRAIPIAGNAFNGAIELRRTHDAVFFEGGVVVGQGAVPISFRLSVPFGSIHPRGASATFFCLPLGELQGELLSCGPGFEFLGVAGEKAVALHVWFEGTETAFHLTGIFQTEVGSFAFSAGPSSQWQPAEQSKVRVLHPR